MNLALKVLGICLLSKLNKKPQACPQGTSSCMSTRGGCVKSTGNIHPINYHGQGEIREGFPEEVTQEQALVVREEKANRLIHEPKAAEREAWLSLPACFEAGVGKLWPVVKSTLYLGSDEWFLQ